MTLEFNFLLHRLEQVLIACAFRVDGVLLFPVGTNRHGHDGADIIPVRGDQYALYFNNVLCFERLLHVSGLHPGF